MTEADAIAATPRPVTASSLTHELRDLGVTHGDVVIVHSSLSALGWVAGGPQSAVEALLAAVGAAGTIVMPTQSGQLSDPANWSDPPVPADWLDDVRANLPAYDAHLTPTRAMGQVVDCFRQHPSTIRSPHPLVSFAANGPAAVDLVAEHPVSPAFGHTSPLARLYDADAQILLLGVGHGNNTSLHLAEHRADWVGKQHVEESAPMLIDGERQWVTWTDLEANEDDFDQIGEALATTDIERVGPVGTGVARLASQRAVVDFAATWMSANRPASLGDTAT
ncbi:aminoglycoside N(3)-acetyltransferase [Ilumatobacter coccineus]|uniref:Aminoglycoside N(3)-acetyltransferase n=1 Tax=Ilumatobacter coccineus (strain NBRC 103263 / KCTC 29153 / YM16-304) TaxID=1313172 RepID=A0A6C7EEM4_ILUCY|nr:AAC(3) family N-acetyltransferase [Ilumatobacter coccineus]BAN03078.1 putative aminoglycoside 3-N-acetyltransferase [Ilumatobacter coccineus YM16-304]